MKSRLSLVVMTLGLVIVPGVAFADVPPPFIAPLAVASARVDLPPPIIPPLAVASARVDLPPPIIPPLATPSSR
jgi:hypothetical protein